MTLPNGRSYDLGETEEAGRYFRDVLKLGGICGFGDRALDCAVNWPAAVVIPATGQCYGAETEEGDQVMGRGDLFRTEAEKRDEPALVGVSRGLPGYV